MPPYRCNTPTPLQELPFRCIPTGAPLQVASYRCIPTGAPSPNIKVSLTSRSPQLQGLPYIKVALKLAEPGVLQRPPLRLQGRPNISRARGPT